MKKGSIYKHYRGKYIRISHKYKRDDGELMVCFEDGDGTLFTMTMKKFNGHVRANMDKINRFNLVRKDKNHPWYKG